METMREKGKIKVIEGDIVLAEFDTEDEVREWIEDGIEDAKEEYRRSLRDAEVAASALRQFQALNRKLSNGPATTAEVNVVPLAGGRGRPEDTWIPCEILDSQVAGDESRFYVAPRSGSDEMFSPLWVDGKYIRDVTPTEG